MERFFFPFLPHISPAWEKNRIKEKIEKDLPTPTEDKKSQMENPQAKNEILRKYHFRFRPVSVSQVDSTIVRLVWEQQHSDWGGVGPSQGSCLWWMGSAWAGGVLGLPVLWIQWASVRMVLWTWS